jgi:type II secretory ATPase GspE/PulE/Tfp pilus assembly ATPase PilB-like protein
MIGEIRDLETAEIAVQAALTGHLVFSTLHTNDSAGAVTRLIDMGVEPFLVASTVEGVMAQRLLRTVCSGCRETVKRDRNGAPEAALPEDIRSYSSGRGCDNCRGTGYRGRSGLFEVFAMDDAMRDLIVRRESSGRIKRYARDHGMKTLREDGWDRVREGRTTPEEVMRIAKED